MARGGSYIHDPTTGRTTLVAETKEAPLPDPVPAPEAIAPAEAAQPADQPAEARSARRRAEAP